MTAIAKRRAFKFAQLRRQRLKPVWHDYNCADCGVRLREFSDPRASLHLCHDCIARRTGRGATTPVLPPQARPAVDWWTLWCLEYESKKAAGLT